MKNSMEALQKTKVKLPYDPTTTLPGIYFKQCESGYKEVTCTAMFIATLFTKAKVWKQPRCPTTDEWNNKTWCLYTIQPQRGMKFSHLQLYGWNWRTSY
jgi:hypothetical protein